MYFCLIAVNGDLYIAPPATPPPHPLLAHSWQVLSFTDAVLAPIHQDQVGNGSLPHNRALGRKHSPLKVDQPPPQDTSTGGEGGAASSERKRRLLAVKSIFTRLYPSSIQRQPSEPSGGALSSLFNKLTSSLKISTWGMCPPFSTIISTQNMYENFSNARHVLGSV